MNLGPWQELNSFTGAGTFVVRLGAGTGRARWLAWNSDRSVIGEADDEVEAERQAREALLILSALL